MQSRKANFTKRGSVRSQFIGDDNRESKALATKQFTEEAQGRCLVTLGLNENFQNLAFAIDSAPHVHLLSRERDPHFIQMPPRVAVGTGLPQILGNYWTEFEHPSAD